MEYPMWEGQREARLYPEEPEGFLVRNDRTGEVTKFSGSESDLDKLQALTRKLGRNGDGFHVTGLMYDPTEGIE